MGRNGIRVKRGEAGWLPALSEVVLLKRPSGAMRCWNLTNFKLSPLNWLLKFLNAQTKGLPYQSSSPLKTTNVETIVATLRDFHLALQELFFTF